MPLIETKTITDIDNNEEEKSPLFACSICKNEKKDYVVTKCGHEVCGDCLRSWRLLGDKSCPICKINLEALDFQSVKIAEIDQTVSEFKTKVGLHCTFFDVKIKKGFFYIKDEMGNILYKKDPSKILPFPWKEVVSPHKGKITITRDMDNSKIYVSVFSG